MNKMQRPDYFDIECALSIDSRIFHANLNGEQVNRVTEKELLIKIVSWLWQHEHGPAVMGKNLIFDLKHIQARCEFHKLQAHIVRWQYNVQHIDLKEIAVLLNDGFKGYQRWIDRADKPSGAEVPVWHERGEWSKIEEYSDNERTDTLRFYEWMIQTLGKVSLADRPY